MPIPATSGNFVTNPYEAQTGDYFAAKYTASNGAAGVISDIGASLATAQANELPITGSATPNGYFYYVKVDTGLFIPDRVVQHSVSFDTLNTAALIHGKNYAKKYQFPQMTSNSQNGYTVAQSSDYPGGYLAYRAFDGNVSTQSHTNGETRPWFKVGFPAKTKLSGCEWTENQSSTYLNGYEIYVSDDDVTYTLFQSGTLSANKQKTLLFNKEFNYKYFKIVNTSNSYISFFDFSFYEFSFLVRSLSGGCAYLGANEKPSFVFTGDTDSMRCFPSTNEWDKYILGSTLGGKITAGDENVWHYRDGFTYCQETILTGGYSQNGSAAGADNTMRVCRGYNNIGGAYYKNFSYSPTSGAYFTTLTGFRPVLEIVEPKSNAQNPWY